MTLLARLAPRPRQVFVALLVAVVMAGVFVGAVYARTSIPSPSAVASQQTTTIYYSDGKHVLARIGQTNRTDVSLSQVPVAVRHAVLAAEDRHFYSEPGVSPTGIMRALIDDVRGGDITQGGSTITQQYAKNAYLSDQRSLTRKLKEIVIATKLGQSRSKNSVLSDYLNTIYFGRDAYGIQAASEAYFGVPVGALNVAQGALLAAVIRGPGLYDPRIDKAAARSRFGYVLNGMVSQGWLSRRQAARLRLPHTVKSQPGQANCHLTSCYIRDAVVHELLSADGFTQAQLDEGGYKIVTTINRNDEAGLISAEHAVLPPNRTGTPESGAASIVPGNGAIEALYGGTDYCRGVKRDRDACIDLSGATGAWSRPAGSSFKAFTLLAALQQGISLNSTFDGPYEIQVGGDTIHNSSPGESCFGCTLISAFARSINTIFVPLAEQVGPEKVAAAAHAAGIPSSVKLDPVPDITLGVSQVSPVQLADAYATIAAQGVYAQPYLVRSVTTTRGHRVYTSHPHTRRAFPQSVTSDATFAMERVLESGGTAAGNELLGRPAAGKTGTTDANTNAWFTGFTPQLCTSVWIGNVNAQRTVEGAGVGEVFGGTLPAEIWKQAMDAALSGQPVQQFPPPSESGVIENSASPSPSATASSKSATPTPTRSSSSATPTPTPTTPTPSSTPTVPAPPASTGPPVSPGGPPSHARRH